MAKTTGAWLKPLAPHLTVEMGAIDRALRLLELVEADPLPNPVEDARWDRLLKLIQDRLRDGQRWVDDERLIIFTEYKTTLDYLARRLQATFKDAGAIRVLFGGMPDVERESIKQAFNDPADPVRILVATDAASEGLNLQETARFVLHYDIPFNPARLDQRNGRLDRHGQARDVVVFHFTSEDDADLRFLAHVVNKVNTIREELGSMGEVFDAAFERRFMYDQDTDSILADLDRAVEARRGRSQIPQAEPAGRSAAEEEALAWLTREIDLSPQTLRDTLEQALGFDLGLPRFEPVNGRVRLQMPLPPRWEPLIDSSLRLKGAGEQRGALPALTFDPHYFIQMRNGRPVFRSSKDTVMLHLGHPMFQRALAMFARARFPGSDGASATRWTVRYGQVPPRADALVLLTLEELAVNELRETFHHWVRTLRLPVIGGELGEPLPHVPPAADRPTARTPDREAIATAQQIWDDVELDVRDFLKRVAETVTREIKQRLADGGKQAVQEEKERFRHRVREVEQAMKENSLNRLEREWRAIEAERQTLRLAPALLAEVQVEQAERIREIERRQADLEEELNRRRHHYEALLESLKREEKRVIEQLLPRRYQLRGAVQVFPVTVEIRLPEVSR